MFIRVYRLERQSVMLVFSTQLCELLPLSPFLVQLPPPLPCVNKHTVYTYTLCGGGYGVLGLRQINTCRKAPLQNTIFSWKQFALPSMSLIFLRSAASNYRVLIRCKIYISSANNFRSALRNHPIRNRTVAQYFLLVFLKFYCNKVFCFWYYKCKSTYRTLM